MTVKEEPKEIDCGYIGDYNDDAIVYIFCKNCGKDTKPTTQASRIILATETLEKSWKCRYFTKKIN